jgi:hypothetical protein
MILFPDVETIRKIIISQNATPELVSGHIEEGSLSEMEDLDAISNVCVDSQDHPDIPPPPTVYYKGASLDNMERVAREYKGAEFSITDDFDHKGDIHREVVDDIPQSNTSVDWKYCRPSLLHVSFHIHALAMGVDVPLC